MVQPLMQQEEDESHKTPPFPSYVPYTNFPWQALPEMIQATVLEICQNDKVAVPIAVQAVLAAVSVACQDLVLVDRGFGEPSACSLFMLAVVDSGARKTRADRAVTPAIEAYDREMRGQYEQEKAKQKNELKALRTKERALERTYASLIQKVRRVPQGGAQDLEQLLERVEGELGELRAQLTGKPEPKCHRVLYSSISIRELERSLCENWPAAGLISSEAADFLNARNESDMARLDRLWDGLGIDVVGRTAKDTFSVSDPRLTMSLMIQPSVFDGFLDRKGETAKGIGFIPRMLISRPETAYGERSIDGSALRSNAWIKLFTQRIIGLLKCSHVDVDQRARNRLHLHFSSHAQQRWETDHNAKELETAEDGKYTNEREFINRYSEHVARLAALFHFFESAKPVSDTSKTYPATMDPEISRDSVSSAIQVCEWYLIEFSRIFNPDLSLAEAADHVFGKLQKRIAAKNGGVNSERPTYAGRENRGMPVNHLRNHCTRYGLRKNNERFQQALIWLEENHKVVTWLSDPGKTGGRSTRYVSVADQITHGYNFAKPGNNRS